MRAQLFSLSAKYQLLHGSASNVIGTGRSVNGDRPKPTRYKDPKPPDRSKPNSTQFITFEGTFRRPKLIISRSKGAPPTFLLFVSCHRTQRKRVRPILTIYTSYDSVSRKEAPFASHNASENFREVHIPEPPKFGPGIEIFSLNKTVITLEPFMRFSLE
jgi:hypothetical protein